MSNLSNPTASDLCQTSNAKLKGEADASDGSVRQMMRTHICLLGLAMAAAGSEWTKKKWPRATSDATEASGASRLMALKREAAREGASRGDEAYMRSVTKDGQEGRWAALVHWCQPFRG